MIKSVFQKQYNFIVNFLINLHGLVELFGRILVSMFTRPSYMRDTLDQMYAVGVRSLIIILMTAGFTGMVLSLQSGYEMAIYGAKMYVGTLVSVSLVRELGPVLVSLVVAGRVGAGITAELGSMNVTEQIDAMRALGTNPIKKLAATRFKALVIMLPLLTIIGDITGILGGLVIATTSLGISSSFYWTTVTRAITFNDIFTGTIKPVIFAMIIVTVSCFMGFKASGGTRGVGEATTQSVVVSSILIFIFDFFITKLLLSITWL
ncbi:MAG TPA: ABC transporter permease [bacterium]|nr:ABC transporter permease [bacterium]HPN43368.1 ABC transporter permease [bacterium]